MLLAFIIAVKRVSEAGCFSKILDDFRNKFYQILSWKAFFILINCSQEIKKSI